MESDQQRDRRMIIDADWKAETTQSLRTLVEAIKGPQGRFEDGIEHKVDSLMEERAQRRAARAATNAIVATMGAGVAGLSALWLAFHDGIIAFFRGVK